MNKSNKKYKKLLLVLLFAAVGNNVITPFLGTYQVNELGFSMTFISIITVVFSGVSMLFVLFFGKRHGKKAPFETVPS